MKLGITSKKKKNFCGFAAGSPISRFSDPSFSRTVFFPVKKVLVTTGGTYTFFLHCGVHWIRVGPGYTTVRQAALCRGPYQQRVVLQGRLYVHGVRLPEVLTPGKRDAVLWFACTRSQGYGNGIVCSLVVRCAKCSAPGKASPSPICHLKKRYNTDSP
jgi:hypothetical protein